VTSFNETPIQVRHENPRVRRCYLPIYPADHPDTDEVLTIAHKKMLKKKSYVKTDHVHQLAFSMLNKYWADEDLHLDGESYRTLVTAIWKQTLTKYTVELLSYHSMKPPPMRHYQSAGGWTPVIGSNIGEENALLNAQTPSSVPSLPVSSLYGTFPGSLRSNSAYLNSLPRITVAPPSIDLRPNRYSYYYLPSGGPKRPTFLERLMKIITWKDVKKYTITTILVICILVACWYTTRQIWFVVQMGIAIGRDVYNWLTNILSAIGGVITRWVEALRNSLGGRLTDLT
jgi:hypothetical protein